MRVDAYYSNAMKCWVRLEREADGEWCHTSGYATQDEALGRPHTLTKWAHPCDVGNKQEDSDEEDSGR
jgi:hypothetical protein